MKYLIIFIMISMNFLSGFSQDTLNQTGPNGLKEGYWRKTDSSGKKIFEGRFRNGVPTGTLTYYYPSGKTRAVSVFSDNGTRSFITTYFESGNKMARGHYVNEKRDSIWQFFSEFDQALLSEESYHDGKKDGPSKTFYAGKGTAEVIFWKDGVQEGEWIQYYSDGNVKMRTSCVNGMKEGKIEAFAENGKFLFKGNYSQGDPDGEWIYFDEKGVPVSKETYDKGALVSKEEISNKK